VLGVGADGQVLTACTACTTGLTWAAAAGAAAATPTALGTVFGRTLASGTALGFKALNNNPVGLNTGVGASALENNTSGQFNVAVGTQALFCSTTGEGNTGLGVQSLFQLTSGCNNVAIGRGAAQNNFTGQDNVAIGWGALSDNNSGCFNVAVGRFAGANCIVNGSRNIAIGPDVSLRGASGLSCRLAIGFSDTQNWLTGDSSQAIRPEAGIIDCTGSCGTAGQVLMSNGSNAICWGTAGGGGAVTRATTSVTTTSIVNNGIANVSITIPATYALLKIQTSDAAWVTLYTDTASRTADASRTEFTDPLPGTGVIAEVITSGATTQLISPGTIGFSSDGTNTSYAKIVNKSGATAAITVTLTYVKLEG
jgi:hypothetical protein